MTNELTQDAEESATIEKTAIEPSESTAAAEAVALTTEEVTAAEEPAVADDEREGGGRGHGPFLRRRAGGR